MSILQEYKEIQKEIGYRKFNMIEDYINEICPKEKIDKYEKDLAKISGLDFYDWLDEKKKLEKKYRIIFLSDVLYNRHEWEKFEKWYKEKNNAKEIEILNTWLSDYDDMRCNAIIKIDGKEVANIIASYDEMDLRYTFGNNDIEMNDEFIKDAFKYLILCDLDDYLKLPKISKCSKLLQNIYDVVCSSDASMCHISEKDWENDYSDDYSDEDIENLKLEIEKYGLQEVVSIYDGEYKIVGYGDLEIRFNDDRKLEKDKNIDLIK